MSSSTTTKTTKTTKVVSVVNREGSFFDDSFFEDNWGDFDSAMKQILQKFETDATPKIDFGNRNTCTDVYRKIRSSNIEKDLYQSQALQVTEKDGKFQCVMDVKDFTPNDLQVKIVDDRVVIEGKYEKKSEDGSSSSSKSFHKEFTLPSVADIELLSTALSKDGVLTIKAPKKEGTEVAVPPSGAVTSSSTSSSVQESSSSKTDDGDLNSSSVQQSSKSEKKSFSSTSSSTFSSSKKVSMTSSSSVDMNSSSNLLDDMSKDMQDRLVFTHDTVNVKLPGGAK